MANIKKSTQKEQKKGNGFEAKARDTEEELKSITSRQAEGGVIDNDELLRLISAEDKESEEELESEPGINFVVNGTRLNVEGEKAAGNRIPLFQGAVLDLSAIELTVVGGGEEKKYATMTERGGAGARLVIAPTHSKIIQEFPVETFILRNDMVRDTSELAVEGCIKKGSMGIMLEDGSAFMASEGRFDTAVFTNTTSGQVYTADGKSLRKDIAIDESGIHIDGHDEITGLVNQNREAARKSGTGTGDTRTTGDDESIGKDVLSVGSKTSGETNTGQNHLEDSKNEKQDNPVDQDKDVLEPVMFQKVIELFSSGDDGEEKEEDDEETRTVKEWLKKTLEEKKDEFIDELKDYFKDEIKDGTLEILKTSFQNSKEKNLSISNLKESPLDSIRNFTSDVKDGVKEGITTKIKGMPDDLKDAVTDKIWEQIDEVSEKVEWAKELIGCASAYLHLASYLGVNIKPIEDAMSVIIDALADFNDMTQDKLDILIPKTEEDSEEENDEENEDGKKYSVELEIIPDMFSLEFYIKPSYNLSFSGKISMPGVKKGQPINVNIGVGAHGYASVEIGVGAKAGNKLFAIVADVSGTGRVLGMMEDKKFAYLSLENINLGKIKENGEPELIAGGPSFDQAHFNINAGMEGEISAAIAANSELFSWDKELVKKSVKATLGAAIMTGDVTKEGDKLFSLKGWKLDNTRLTTAFFNEKKADLMRLSIQESTIAKAEDLQKSAASEEQRLEELDEQLASLHEALSASAGENTLGAVFSNEEGNYADQSADVFARLRNDYNFVFINLSERSRAISNAIMEFLRSKEAMNVDQAAAEGEEKHTGRLTAMNAWEEGLSSDRNESYTREEVLAEYRTRAAGSMKQILDMKTGYERQDKKETEKQAEDELYSKEEIEAYEQKKVEEAIAKRKNQYAILMDLYEKYGKTDPEKFRNEYDKLTRDDPDGNLLRKIAEYGRGESSQIFDSDAEAIGELLGYEEKRFDENTKKLAEKIDKLNAKLKSMEEAQKELRNQEFIKEYKDADEDMWHAFVLANTDEKDRADYERIRLAGTDQKNEARVSLKQSLLADQTAWENASDEEAKQAILEKAKGSFESLLKSTQYRAIGGKTEWEDFLDPASRFKRLNSDDIKQIAEKYATDEGYHAWSGAEKDSLTLFQALQKVKDGDPQTALDLYNGNKKVKNAYSDYLDNAKTDVRNSLAIWNLQSILDYELAIANSEVGEGGKLKDRDRYYKHYERAHFLEIANRTSSRSSESKLFDADDFKAEILEHYFKGTRPDYADPITYKSGFFTQTTVTVKPEAAEQYRMERLKTLRDGAVVLGTAEGRDILSEALSFALSKGRKKREEAYAAIGNLGQNEKEDPRKVMAAWTSAGGSKDFLNESLSSEAYGFHEMISYLDYKIGRKGGEAKKDEFFDYAAENELAGKSEAFSPVRLMAFAEEYKKTTDAKHTERLALVRSALDSNNMPVMTFDELMERYNDLASQDGSGIVEKGIKQAQRFFGSQPMRGFDRALMKDKKIRSRITPELILAFESNRIEEGNRKHKRRLEAVRGTEPERAREVYNSEALGGGAGFYESIRGRIRERGAQLRLQRSGREELEHIRSYENSAIQRYRKMREDALKDKTDLEAKQNEIMDSMNASARLLQNTDEQIRLLRNRPKNLGEYKKIPEIAGTIDTLKLDKQKFKDRMKDMEQMNEKLSLAVESRKRMIEQLDKTRKTGESE